MAHKKMKQAGELDPKSPSGSELSEADAGLTYDRWAASTGVPLIDTMATEWLAVDELAHMPSLHNFHEMGACSPELLGVNYLPGGQLYAGSGEQIGACLPELLEVNELPEGQRYNGSVERWFDYNTLPLVQLSIHGQVPNATRCWFPHQAIRSRRIERYGRRSCGWHLCPGILYGWWYTMYRTRSAPWMSGSYAGMLESTATKTWQFTSQRNSR